MTDRERLTTLLREFGVHFEEADAQEWWPGEHADPPWPRPDAPQIKITPAHVTIPSRGGPKNGGYDGFVCIFDFEDDGSFMKVSVEE